MMMTIRQRELLITMGEEKFERAKQRNLMMNIWDG